MRIMANLRIQRMGFKCETYFCFWKISRGMESIWELASLYFDPERSCTIKIYFTLTLNLIRYPSNFDPSLLFFSTKFSFHVDNLEFLNQIR